MTASDIDTKTLFQKMTPSICGTAIKGSKKMVAIGFAKCL